MDHLDENADTYPAGTRRPIFPIRPGTPPPLTPADIVRLREAKVRGVRPPQPPVADTPPDARQTAEDAVRFLLAYVGEDPDRAGLRETPARVVRAMTEMTAGYRVDVPALFKTFPSDGADEIICVRDVTFTSLCEHHCLTFSGVVHVAYLPTDMILGLSKFARLVEAFALRLQVQERLTMQVREAIDEHLKPKGSAVVVRATHSCMACRGVRKAGAEMITSSLSGPFKEDPKTRAEFFRLIER